MINVYVDDVHKWTVEPMPEANAGTVTLYEKMGNRWVALGTPEIWSNELIESDLDADLKEAR